MNIGKNAAFFALGGSAYVGLELLWRGRSHISMFGAGGVCFLLLGPLGKHSLALPIRAAAGAGVIGTVELLTGLLVNRDYRVWDYRDRWGNYRGQVCPAYLLLWAPLSLTAMELYQWLDRNFSGKNLA